MKEYIFPICAIIGILGSIFGLVIWANIYFL